MTETYLAVIAVAVVVIAATQVAVVIVAVRVARGAGELSRRLEEEIKPVLAEVRSLSADAARSAALLASQAERVDRLAGRMSHRIDAFAASPLRDGMALVRTLIEAWIGGRQGGASTARERRRAQEPEDEAPGV